jgi:hypothetical protein
MKTSKDANEKLKKAIDALSGYEKKYHVNATVARRLVEVEAKDRSPMTLNELKKKLSVRGGVE